MCMLESHWPNLLTALDKVQIKCHWSIVAKLVKKSLLYCNKLPSSVHQRGLCLSTALDKLQAWWLVYGRSTGCCMIYNFKLHLRIYLWIFQNTLAFAYPLFLYGPLLYPRTPMNSFDLWGSLTSFTDSLGVRCIQAENHCLTVDKVRRTYSKCSLALLFLIFLLYLTSFAIYVKGKKLLPESMNKLAC